MTDATPRLTRNRFHLFANVDDPDADPTFVATLAITNADQLLAEKQAKGLGIQVPRKDAKGLVRTGRTTAKFKEFVEAFQWEGVDEPDADQGEAEPDPTFGEPEASTEPG
jgi:hypothetical protein